MPHDDVHKPANDETQKRGQELNRFNRNKKFTPRVNLADAEVSVELPDIHNDDGSPDVHVASINDDDKVTIYAALSQSSLDPPDTTFLDMKNLLAYTSVIKSFNCFLDSGCSVPLIHDHNTFWTYDEEGALNVQTANCSVLNTLAHGEVQMLVDCGKQPVTLIWSNCLHAPDCPVNLLSVGAMTEHRMCLVFKDPYVTIFFPHDKLELKDLSFKADIINHLPFLHCKFIFPTLQQTNMNSFAMLSHPIFHPLALTFPLWHQRLGHPGGNTTRDVLTKDYATGITYTGSLSHSSCVLCIVGKCFQASYEHNANHADNVCELVHMDICGHFPVKESHGKKYFLVLLDDKSSLGVADPTSMKKGPETSFIKHTKQWEAKSGKKVLKVQFDGAKEFSKGKLSAYFTENRIVHQTTTPYTHQQNGKIECFICTIEDDTQTLLADANLLMSFIYNMIRTSSYLRQCLPTLTLPPGITPYEVMHGKKPDLSHLRVWGCCCWVIQPPEIRSKAAPHCFEAIFIGYKDDRIGWLV